MSAEKEARPERAAPKVELIVHDPAAKGGRLLSPLKGAFAIGLAGAWVLGAAGSFFGRKAVAYSETPAVLASCKEPVEIAVKSAVDSLLLTQGIAMGAGFLLLFFVAFSKLRGS